MADSRQAPPGGAAGGAGAPPGGLPPWDSETRNLEDSRQAPPGGAPALPAAVGLGDSWHRDANNPHDLIFWRIRSVSLLISVEYFSTLIDGLSARDCAYVVVRVFMASESGMLYQYNKLIGGVLITQKRGMQEQCKVSPTLPERASQMRNANVELQLILCTLFLVPAKESGGQQKMTMHSRPVGVRQPHANNA